MIALVILIVSLAVWCNQLIVAVSWQLLRC